RERQVARREGVAGADRPPVGVVDQQAAEPDEQARQELAPAAQETSDRGHDFLLTRAGIPRGPAPLLRLERGRRLSQGGRGKACGSGGLLAGHRGCQRGVGQSPPPITTLLFFSPLSRGRGGGPGEGG